MTIDFLTIHCLATGKPIAQINDDESGFILETVSESDLERFCLMSMRPSLPWLSVTPESLDRMRQSAPKQLLAYLMNRLYAHVTLDKFGKPLNHESFLEARRFRIRNWSIIESADFGSENLDTMLFILLDLDLRFNLTKLCKPQSITTLWESWHSAFAKDFLFNLTQWRTTLVEAQIKRDKQAAYAAEFWSEGNRLTRLARHNQFNSVAPAKRITPSSKPMTPAKIAKAKQLAASVDFLNQLEESLCESMATVPLATAPVKPKVKVRITRFGASKES